ncbi:RICIN domain-containing protein [Streptomyces fradiae]|uniref:RICIN domain-containing protein n=1 Tax=Streptomyces fradiae TaxID=1906 RepID=UPI0033EE21C0
MPRDATGPAGWVNSPSARLYNLTPDTAYTVAVSVRDTSGRDGRPGRATSFRTAGQSGDGTNPAPGTRYVLANGATGNAAEVWGGRTADGTVLVGSQRNGYAQQQWYLDDAGSGKVRIRSAVSGKCLQPGGTPSAGMWVAQQRCSGAANQQWRVSRAGGGVTVTAGDSRYVLGVSNRPYYGSWLIELQHPSGGAAQVWTVQQP